MNAQHTGAESVMKEGRVHPSTGPVASMKQIYRSTIKLFPYDKEGSILVQKVKNVFIAVYKNIRRSKKGPKLQM